MKVRVRIGHSKTQRDGWQYETTIEREWDPDSVFEDDDAAGDLADLARKVDQVARAERDRRIVADLEERQP